MRKLKLVMIKQLVQVHTNQNLNQVLPVSIGGYFDHYGALPQPPLYCNHLYGNGKHVRFVCTSVIALTTVQIYVMLMCLPYRLCPPCHTKNRSFWSQAHLTFFLLLFFNNTVV